MKKAKFDADRFESGIKAEARVKEIV